MRVFLVAVLATCAAAAAAAAQERATAGWVVLGVDDYRALKRKADPAPASPTAPPVVATLTRMEYELRVAGDAAAGTARVTVDAFTSDWITVPIPAELRVTSARLDGRPVALVRSEPQEPHVLIARAGRHVLDLDVAVPVATDSGTESVTLPAAGSAVTRATVLVPRDGVDVSLSGAHLAESGGDARESRWVAYGDGGSPITFSWRRRVEDTRATRPLRYRGAVVQHVGFGEDAAQVVADVRIDVVQGTAPRVGLGIADGLAVHNVEGKNVADWEVRDGVLAVRFLDAVEATERLVVTGEARVPREGTSSIPLLRLIEAERETGGVAVEVLGAGEVTRADTRGMDAADAADLADGTAGRTWGLVSAFRHRPQDGRAPRALTVRLSRYTPEAVLMAAVEEARHQALVTEDGKVLVRSRYAVRNNARGFLLATLPDGATLWSAAVYGRAVRPGRSAEGGLLIPLEKAKAGEEAPAFVVELVYLARGAAWSRDGRASLRLPAVDLPVARTGLVLHPPTRHRVHVEPGAFRLQPACPPSSPVLNAAVLVPAAGAAPKDPSPLAGFLERRQKVATGTRGTAGAPPIAVPFPEYGPALFLGAELTAENDAPVIELRYKQTKKGGRG